MMAAIFFASSLPTTPHLPGDPANYLGHASAYAALAASVLRGFARARWSGVSAPAALRAWIASAAYGVTDELHQRYVPGRYPAVDDWFADAAGAAGAVVAIAAVARWIQRPKA
jgi:VanZ family protein